MTDDTSTSNVRHIFARKSEKTQENSTHADTPPTVPNSGIPPETPAAPTAGELALRELERSYVARRAADRARRDVVNQRTTSSYRLPTKPPKPSPPRGGGPGGTPPGGSEPW